MVYKNVNDVEIQCGHFVRKGHFVMTIEILTKKGYFLPEKGEHFKDDDLLDTFCRYKNPIP